MIIKIAEGDLNTKYGSFHESLYYDGQKESFALTVGQLDGATEVLCRVHSSCIFAHHFNSIDCDCREQMAMSQQIIQAAGRGVVVWLDQEGKGNGHYALLHSKAHKKTGLSQADAYEAVGFKSDARDYVKVAEILKDLGVQSIIMLTNNPKKVVALEKQGIVVTSIKPILMEAGDNPILQKDLDEKKAAAIQFLSRKK